jgi:hypothetical protein
MEVLSGHGVITDISAQKTAEAAMMKERDKAQMYLDIAGVMMVAINAKGNILF